MATTSQLLRSVIALPPWIFGAAFLLMLGRVSGSRPRLLEHAELLAWAFCLGVFVPAMLHLILVVKERPPMSALSEMHGARVGFYSVTLTAVAAVEALLVFASAPDPAGFADALLLYLGRPWILSLVIASLVAACALLTLSFPPWVAQWTALNARAEACLRWAGGLLASLFGLAGVGVISYYALGWAWWVGSTP